MLTPVNLSPSRRTDPFSGIHSRFGIHEVSERGVAPIELNPVVPLDALNGIETGLGVHELGKGCPLPVKSDAVVSGNALPYLLAHQRIIKRWAFLGAHVRCSQE